jgi:hypothetical protein
VLPENLSLTRNADAMTSMTGVSGYNVETLFNHGWGIAGEYNTAVLGTGLWQHMLSKARWQGQIFKDYDLHVPNLSSRRIATTAATTSIIFQPPRWTK